MKRLIPIFILSLFLLSLEPAGAQVYEAPPVTVSTEKVRIGGETYYSHKVIEKQTLYSISKAYGVKTVYDGQGGVERYELTPLTVTVSRG